MKKLRTQVGIIGVGPADLLLVQSLKITGDCPPTKAYCFRTFAD